MAGIAKVTLIGNLGNEPETKILPSGTTALSFSVAVNRRGRQGEQEITDWYRVTAYGKQAEGLDKLAQMGGLAKGRQVYVEGRLEPRLYEKDGQTRLSLDVNATEVQALGVRPGGELEAGGGQRVPRRGDDDFGSQDIEEIPF